MDSWKSVHVHFHQLYHLQFDSRNKGEPEIIVHNLQFIIKSQIK